MTFAGGDRPATVVPYDGWFLTSTKCQILAENVIIIRKKKERVERRRE
jgi:hypothetical protein